MDHPKSELKYVDARDLNGTAARLDGAEMLSADGEKLGVVEGFIVDVLQERPRHVVVSAGWFIHKHFLLPIGHVTLSPDRTWITADITKDRVSSFPGFNKAEFQKLNGPELGSLDHMMAKVVTAATDIADNANIEAHYRMPDGW